MKSIIAINLLILLLSSCTQFKSDDYKELNLKGKVKSVKSKKFEAEEKFGEVQRSYPTDADENNELDMLSNSLIEFDELGKSVAISNFYRNGSLLSKMVVDGLNINMYDEEGNLTGVLKSDEEHFPKEVNIYDASGELIEKSKYTYNDEKLLVEEQTYDEKGTLIRKEVHEYISDLLSRKTISERKVYYSSYGDMYEIEKSYKYNDNKDVTEQEVTKRGNVTTYTFEYEYDDKNNWIKRIQYRNNKPKAIVEREIVYY